MNNLASKTIFLFTALAICQLLIYYLNQTLLTEGILYNDLLEKVNQDQALRLMERRAQPLIILLEYSLQVVWLFIRVCFITLCVVAGCFLFNISFQRSLLFRAVVIADFIHLVAPLITFLWFSLVDQSYSSHDLNSFTMLSVSELFTTSRDDPYYSVYRSLKSFNLHELLFCSVLSYQLSNLLGIDWVKAAKAVFISYFSALGILALLKAYVAASFL